MVARVGEYEAIMIVVDRNAPWAEESVIVERKPSHARAPREGAERRQELAATRIVLNRREYLHSTVVTINDEQVTPMVVERQAARIREHAVGLARLFGADREPDASLALAHRRLGTRWW